jgi:hypothetical protein
LIIWNLFIILKINRFLSLFLIVSGLFILISGKAAFATHETDHRYTIHGLVKEASGIPRPNVKVTVSDTLTGEGNTVFTDQNGFYEVLLHLHNSNLGDEIRVSAGSMAKVIKAEFNPEDKKTERKAEVNFEFAPPEGRKSNKGWSLIAGILLVIGFIFLTATVFKQRKALK